MSRIAVRNVGTPWYDRKSLLQFVSSTCSFAASERCVTSAGSSGCVTSLVLDFPSNSTSFEAPPYTRGRISLSDFSLLIRGNHSNIGRMHWLLPLDTCRHERNRWRFPDDARTSCLNSITDRTASLNNCRILDFFSTRISTQHCSASQQIEELLSTLA